MYSVLDIAGQLGRICVILFGNDSPESLIRLYCRYEGFAEVVRSCGEQPYPFHSPAGVNTLARDLLGAAEARLAGVQEDEAGELEYHRSVASDLRQFLVDNDYEEPPSWDDASPVVE